MKAELSYIFAINDDAEKQELKNLIAEKTDHNFKRLQDNDAIYRNLLDILGVYAVRHVNKETNSYFVSVVFADETELGGKAIEEKQKAELEDFLLN